MASRQRSHCFITPIFYLRVIREIAVQITALCRLLDHACIMLFEALLKNGHFWPWCIQLSPLSGTFDDKIIFFVNHRTIPYPVHLHARLCLTLLLQYEQLIVISTWRQLSVGLNPHGPNLSRQSTSGHNPSCGRTDPRNYIYPGLRRFYFTVFIVWCFKCYTN